jgi:formylmethanofuran dehydrogenase subunit A
MPYNRAIIIKNGILLDPLNKINLEKMDILIENGVYVDKIKDPSPIEIDANNLLIMPGGIDIHTHFAGSKVNLARALRPEEHRIRNQAESGDKPIGSGWATPTSKMCGYLYAKMGYTELIEPAIPPIKARHTHEEMNEVPFVDKKGLLLLGNNWIVMDCISNNNMEFLEDYILWVLWATKTYGIKLVSPGSVEAWGWGRDLKGIDEQVPFFNITPREIIYTLAKVNEKLKLPHSIHLHANDLGRPGNYLTTIESLKTVRSIKKGSSVNPFTIHLTHAQFSCYKGDSWKNFNSASEELSKYINNNNNISFDLGQVVFGNITTITADGGWQYRLHKLTGNKWVNTDIEVESGGGIVPYTFHRKNFVNAIQWAIGLELALLTKDIWKVHLTTDHPNAAPFTSYPVIISWLISRKFRELMLEKINKNALQKIVLPSLDRELSLFEIAVITRSAQARTLGLTELNGFKKGNSANLALFDLDPFSIDSEKNVIKIIKGFSQTRYTIKDGVIVISKGQIKNEKFGNTGYIGKNIESGNFREFVDNYFEKYYTITKENFILRDIENLKKCRWG